MSDIMYFVVTYYGLEWEEIRLITTDLEKAKTYAEDLINEMCRFHGVQIKAYEPDKIYHKSNSNCPIYLLDVVYNDSGLIDRCNGLKRFNKIKLVNEDKLFGELL